MKNIRKNFERFCYRHRDKGIPNLMLYITLGSALVFIMGLFDKTGMLYYILCFDRAAILQGQIWRLITYPLTFSANSLIMTAIGLFCYYALGRAMENIWGTLKFNLFYFSGVLLQNIFCMIFGGQATATYLNLSLFLAYATLYPNTNFLLFFIIPVKAWIFALFYLGLASYSVIMMTYIGLFPYSLFPFVALLNYFLFFGKEMVNVFPASWRINARRLFRKKTPKKTGPIPFQAAGSYQATVATPRAPYTHRCTVCGKTDVSHPDLEFRYCSRCNGYHCYCEEHINNHSHIQ